jgi:hypothetical protein
MINFCALIHNVLFPDITYVYDVIILLKTKVIYIEYKD